MAQGRQQGLQGETMDALVGRLEGPSSEEINAIVALFNQGRYTEVEVLTRHLTERSPKNAFGWKALGTALKSQGRCAEALEAVLKAVELAPEDAEAHSNLGVILTKLGRPMNAEASYRRSLEIKPDYTEVYNNLLCSLNYTVSHTPSYCLKQARKFGLVAAKKAAHVFSFWPCEAQPQRLRVGLVSGDMRNHPVGYFLEALLPHLDPARIELIAYPVTRGGDDLTVRLKPCFAAWKPLAGLSDEAAARLIRADGIHLLLDLSGHTRHNRLPVFAWKPAPVQATWLGYFATTGVKEMDYLLGDPYVTPAGEENHFTETVWRLPECYACFTPPDTAVNVGPLPALSDGCVTFGCFNNLTKMNDSVVDLWSRVLKAVPGSRLFLKTKQLNDPALCDATRRRFAACGITPERLMLEGASPRGELLSAYNRVDIALDPFPYPGGVTSMEALWGMWDEYRHPTSTPLIKRARKH
jgi:predicted O-linked N-acetylglucosamine transferase (SPINDLY family)